MFRRRLRVPYLVFMVAMCVFAVTVPPSLPTEARGFNIPIDNLIVIHLENHSFDNLYGLFPGADGLANATSAPPAEGSRPHRLPDPAAAAQQ